jgi:hypothetical protein
MSDDKPRPHDETQPVRPEGAATLPPAPATDSPSATTADPVAAAPAATTASRRGFGERLRSLRGSDGGRAFGLAALIASALAGVIVGGLGFAAVHAIGDDHDRGGWTERHGPMGRDRDGDDGFDRGPMRGGMPGAPGGPGQLPPTTPPEDDDSSAG